MVSTVVLGILWVCPPKGLVCPVLESGTAVCLKCSGKAVEGQSGTLWDIVPLVV